MNSVNTFNLSSSSLPDEEFDSFMVKKPHLKSKKTTFEKRNEFTIKRNSPYKKPKQRLSVTMWQNYDSDGEED